MKICILGNTGKNIDKAYSWFVRTTKQGMRLNGCEIVGFDYKSHSIDEIYNFLTDNNFDILLTHLTFHKHHDTDDMITLFASIRDKGTKVIHTMQDAREEPRYKDDISDGFDLALVNQNKNIPKFQKYWKIPVYHGPYSSMTYKEMGKYDKTLDFGIPVFPGGEFTHKDRSAFIKTLKYRLSIKTIGTRSKEDVRNKTQNFSVSSPCVLGLSTRYNGKIDGYCCVRPFQYGGSGAIIICRPHKGQNNLIPDKYYYTINSYDVKGINQLIEHGNKIKKLSDNQKYEIRKNIFDYIQKNHSSYIRMKQTLEIIQGKRNGLDVGV